MKNQIQPVEILVILDRSGSMSSIRQDAIGGFNTFLQQQQALDGKANLTLVLFDDRYEVPVLRKDIQQVEPLTEETFVPRGTTAMNDAIGKALVELETIAPAKAVICIITDGDENASKEYSGTRVRELITAAEGRNWQVQFLAANIDALSTGAIMGLSASACRGFTADAIGVQMAYDSMNASTALYRAGAN